MRKYESVGFIGLGNMGFSMASNLLKAGIKLVVFDVVKDKFALLPMQQNVTIAQSAAEMMQYTNTVITMLPNSPHVEATINGEKGILAGAKTYGTKDLFIIDMSSISPVVTRKLGTQLADAGVKFIEGPVSGGTSGARDGALTIMAGGPKELIDEAMPLFNIMGKNIINCGECGCGQIVKVVNQQMSAVNLISMSEGFALGVKAGVDPAIMMNVIQKGSGRSWAVENRMPEILKRNFQAGFTIDLHKKDLSLCIELAQSLNVPMYATSLTYEIFKDAQNKGKGKLDNAAIIQIFEEMAGVEVSPKA